MPQDGQQALRDGQAPQRYRPSVAARLPLYTCGEGDGRCGSRIEQGVAVVRRGMDECLDQRSGVATNTGYLPHGWRVVNSDLHDASSRTRFSGGLSLAIARRRRGG